MAKAADVTMRWLRALQFEGSGTGRPPILVDGDSAAATSPVELLLLAAATCTASDVVIILQKQRVKLEGLDVTVRGTRRETEPRRFTAIALHVAVRGEGADDVKVRRAVDLSLEKEMKFTERLGGSLRIESYNAFNHANLSPPATELTSNWSLPLKRTRLVADSAFPVGLPSLTGAALTLTA